MQHWVGKIPDGKYAPWHIHESLPVKEVVVLSGGDHERTSIHGRQRHGLGLASHK